MTSVGRGRGWATAKNREAALRRPGLGTTQDNGHYLTLMKKIDSLCIYSSIPMSEILAIKAMIMIASDDTSLGAVFNFLHEQALMDRQFGIKLAMLAAIKIITNMVDEEGTDLKRIIISTIQTDYENREELKDKSMSHLRNAMSFLGEVYHQLRLKTGISMSFIAAPLLNYMKTILQSASEEDIEVVVTQLSLNGEKIHATEPEELEQLLIHVRTVLVNRNLSSQSRAMLLLAIDLSSQWSQPLSGDLHAFYLAQLGEETLRQIQRCPEIPDIYNITENDVDQKEILGLENGGVGKGVKPLNTEKSIKNEVSPKSNQQNSSRTVNTLSSNPSHGAQTSLPRAIRGLGIRENRKEGTGDRKSRGKKDKLTDEQVWNTQQNNSSKSWGHDDRFERNYEQDNPAACSEPSDVENSRSPE